MKKYLSLSIILVLLFALTGCGLFSSEKTVSSLNPSPTEPGVLLSMYVPQDEQAISGTVTLQKGAVVIENPLTISGNTATASVSNLEAGIWHLIARLRDAVNYVIYEGERDAVVSNNGTITVTMHLEMTPGDATTIVDLTGVPEATSGTVQFSNGEVLFAEEALSITGTEGKAIFTGLEARVWDIKVNLYNASGDLIRAAHNSVQIMPGRMNYVSIDFESGTGDLIINVTWDLPPAFPANVTATLVDNNIKVIWDANTEPEVIGYRVYRSFEQTGPFVRISGVLVEGTEFVDTNVYPENTYWYQVIAVTDEGIDSGFNDNPVSITFSDNNNNPVINSLTASPTNISVNGTSTITVNATDPDGDTLAYNWSASDGTIEGTGNSLLILCTCYFRYLYNHCYC